MSENTLAVITADATALASQEWTPNRLALVARTIAKGATPDELALFAGICQRTGLDPFKRQIYAVKRWDNSEKREVMQTQVAIDGLRLIAQRSGEYRGQVGPEWCSTDGVWRDVWLEQAPPAAARVGVLRSGFAEPVYSVATYREYVQTKRDGSPNAMWSKMPAHMLAKCAEALAIRKAFPDEAGGLYTAEEMAQADHGEHLEHVDARGLVKAAWMSLREVAGKDRADEAVEHLMGEMFPGRKPAELTDDECFALVDAINQEADGIAGSPAVADAAGDVSDDGGAVADADPVTGGTVRVFPVTGSKGDEYAVSVYEDGGWDCTCPARTDVCKHVKGLRRPMPEGTGWLWPGDDGYDNAPTADSAVAEKVERTLERDARLSATVADEVEEDGSPDADGGELQVLVEYGVAQGLTDAEAFEVVARMGGPGGGAKAAAIRGALAMSARSKNFGGEEVA